MSPLATRILYVITDLELGGVPLHLRRLTKAMRTRGLHPLVVSLARPGPVTKMLRDDGIDVHACNGRGGWDFRVIGRLTRIMRDTQPDIIHALLFHANLAARRAAGKVGLPRDRVLCEIQTVEIKRRWHLWVDRWTHRGCRLTIGNSPSVIEHLAAKARIPRDRLRLVRGGIDPAPLRNAAPIDRPSLGLPVDTPIVLWVGRLDPVKGLETLIQAFSLVVVSQEDQGARQKDAHLLLAGEGPLRKRLVKLLNQSEIGGRVHVLGARDDIPALLKTADVFAFPSRTEGLPNALLEAMAAGCPVVTTDVPGCRDLIEHERTGLLVPYSDTAALAGAIRRLLLDRDTAMRLARSALNTVTTMWHIEGMYDGYAALYDAISADR